MRICITHNPDPLNDYDEGSYSGTIVTWHRRYTIGERVKPAEPADFWLELAQEADSLAAPAYEVWEDEAASTRSYVRHYLRQGRGDPEQNRAKLRKAWTAYRRVMSYADNPAAWDLQEQARELADKHYIVLPVYMHDHSGIALSTAPFNGPHAAWDSGQIGYIYATRGECTPEMLAAEVKQYGHYLNGNCYAVQIEHDAGETDFIALTPGFYWDAGDEIKALVHYYTGVVLTGDQLDQLQDQLDEWIEVNTI